MKTNWQKDIHDRLGSYEKDAPEGLWEGISRELPKLNDGVMLTHKPQRTAKFRMWRVAGVAAAASVALVIGYSFFGNSAKDNINIATNTTKIQICLLPTRSLLAMSLRASALSKPRILRTIYCRSSLNWLMPLRSNLNWLLSLRSNRHWLLPQ